MKQSIKLAALTVLLALATSVFAAEKKVSFATDASLNGRKIAKGDYKISYNVNGTTADVQITQHKKTIASATGHVVEAATSFDRDRVVYIEHEDGSKSLVEIQLAKQKTAIRFDSENASLGK